MTSIFCQLGDLLFSYLKRRAKQKDTGNIFPGHGGVLDRLDGIFLGLPGGLITMLLIS
jgi:phosphatidate cytidylyltransferase